jgi:hypothetical protein
MFSSVADINWWHTRTHSDLGIEENSKSSLTDLFTSCFDFSDPTYNSTLQLDCDPSEISVHYDIDLDLRSLHSIIREKITRNLIKLKTCDQEIYDYNIKIFSNRYTPIDVRDMESKTSELIKFKNKYSNINLWELYKQAVLPILIKYTPLMSKEFLNNHLSGNQISMDDNNIKDRQKYIKQYINEVNKLGIIKIRSYQISYSLPRCPSCMCILADDASPEVNGVAICKCGFTETTVKHLSEYVDTSRSVSSILSTDIYVKQIKQWLDKYQCKFNFEYDKDKLFVKFDAQCIKLNLPNRYSVLNNQLPQPPMSVILTLLKNTKNTDLYNNKHQIRHDYYNYPKPLLTEIQETSVIKMFVEFQNKYNDVKERKSSVHIEILACVFLIMVGVNITISDFKIPIQIETISYSHNIIHDVLKELGYKYEQIPNVRFLFSS